MSGGGDDDYVGGLAGSSYGNVSLVGISGRVVRSGNGPAGGLMGVSAGGRIDETWFAGEVEAEDGVDGNEGIGGLIGHSGFFGEVSGGANTSNNWAHARVVERDGNNEGWAGGLIGRALGGVFENGWTGGEVIGDRPGAFIGRLDSGDSDFYGASNSRGYVDFSTATTTKIVAEINDTNLVTVIGVETMATVSVSQWSNAVWNFGATISDGAADYPFLRRYETMRPGAQAVAYAARQIRLLAGGLEVKRGEAFVLDAGDFDFGHKRPRRRSCAVAVVRAGFEFGRGASGDELQRRDGDFAGDKRGVVVVVRRGRLRRGAFGRGRGVLDFGGGVGGRGGADAFVLFHIGGAFAVFPAPLLSTATANVGDAARLAQLTFVEDIAAGKVDWRIIDPYDWTPTSVTVGGAAIEVNLTLGGADGSAANPWPIYNIWQLQAIASVSVSSDGATMTTGLRLFGDGDNMTAHY